MPIPIIRNASVSRSQTGASLIEILVALFVLSIGLLGLAAMQSKSLQFNQSAQMRTQATFLAYDIIDRIRANLSVVTIDNYASTNPETPRTGEADSSHDCEGNSSVSCTEEDMADADMNYWQYTIEERLPGGLGSIVYSGPDSDPVLNVTITWTDRDDSVKRFSMQVAL